MTEKSSKFRPIAVPLDVDDAALDRVNSRLGVPTLTKPGVKTSTSDHDPVDVPAAPDRPALEKLTIELPRYLADALRREAVERRTTARHLVMLALRKDGFQVDDADLVPDGRRARGKVRTAVVL
ncbi:MAG: hypothetical protein NW217_13730 [Hyphomicrobiaceae bacterium]|nr:hypothetical protein [Hyphomicrobiaceae bacterium]